MYLNKFIILSLCLFSLNIFAAHESMVIPSFFEAVATYNQDVKGGPYSPAVLKIHDLFRAKGLTSEFLNRFQNKSQKSFYLPQDDQAQKMINASFGETAKHYLGLPPISFHTFKVDVLNSSDDFFKDDLYFYFFITDGVIPTGKVSNIYKGLSSGESFFLDEKDRALFPLMGIAAKVPNSHLIVDFGVVESDGDDIKEMQQLSSIIIDIAIAVYAAYDPTNAQILISLRKEVKALADLLIGMNNDDRLVTDTIALTNEELSKMLGDRSFIEFEREYKKNATFDNWKYKIHFRILRE